MSQLNLFLHGHSLFEKCLLDLELVRCKKCKGTGKIFGDSNFRDQLCDKCDATGMNKNPPTHYKGKELTSNG